MIIKNALLNGKITDITIKNGIIDNIGKTDETGFDVEGNIAIPGLVDIHTHGCVGGDTMDGNFEKMSEFLASNGTTSWYPTTMTCPYDKIKSVVCSNTKTNGANILGFHMEGPYISAQYKGAQNKDFIKNPDITEFNSLKNIKLVTIAPELDGSIDFIKQCKAVVCIGHTATDYDTGVNAIKAGAKCLTHTFNAMPPFHHRNPSVIGAAVTENIYVQVICDGLHLHKAAVIALYKIFGKERMILISDSMRATGLSDGTYEFGGQQINVINGVARTSEGAIAGSTSTLMHCVKTAISFGIPFDDAVYMATKTPSSLMKINKGSIEKGFDADILILDKKLNVLKILINGRFYK